MAKDHEITQALPNDLTWKAPPALLAPLLLICLPEAHGPGTRAPAAAHLPTDPRPSWCWRPSSSLTSRDGPSRGRVDTHGWKAGWGKFALTLPVLGPIWGKREGIRAARSHPRLQTPGQTHPRAPARGSAQQGCWPACAASHTFGETVSPMKHRRRRLFYVNVIHERPVELPPWLSKKSSYCPLATLYEFNPPHVLLRSLELCK